MRRILFVMLVAVMLFAVAAPALAQDECVCTPWEGHTRSMGYWKNDGVASNNYWMSTDWQFAYPNGDYKQIFMNQAIAFHNNYLRNPVGGGVEFHDTYVMGPCGQMKSMHDIDAAIHAIIDANFEGYSREQVLQLKDVLDAINNNYGIVVCVPPTNGV